MTEAEIQEFRDAGCTVLAVSDAYLCVNKLKAGQYFGEELYKMGKQPDDCVRFCGKKFYVAGGERLAWYCILRNGTGYKDLVKRYLDELLAQMRAMC